MSVTSSSTPNPRRRAIEALVRIEENNSYIGQSIETDGLEPRERRQLTEYVAGVTRQRRWLDFILAEFYHGEVASLEPKLRQILRLGLYEMLFLQTPIHAAVNESVELAKSEVRSGAGGLVNGVLRSIERARDELPAPDTGSVAEDLAIRHSHPTWMAKRWVDRLGRKDAEDLLEWNNKRPVHGVRANPQRMTPEGLRDALDEEGIAYEPSPYLRDFVRMAHLQPLLKTGWLDEGLVVIQDESAGLAVRVLNPKPEETIVDMCAAPGGKSLYMSALMNGTGRIWACDVNPKRLELLADAAESQNIESIHTIPHDARELPEEIEPGSADRVLLDAPCSGLGVLSKRSDLRWQRSPEDIEELVELQDELLDAAATLLRPGGVLVYSTCTIEPEENEERVHAFLERHPSFQLTALPDEVPPNMLDDDGFISTFPPRDGIDGAFAARMRRLED